MVENVRSMGVLMKKKEGKKKTKQKQKKTEDRLNIVFLASMVGH